jgi:hypothetical protein
MGDITRKRKSQHVMIRSFFGRRASYRRFNYEPRYYDPTKENRVRERLRIQTKVRRGKGGNVFFYILLLSGLLWLMVYFNA